MANFVLGFMVKRNIFSTVGCFDGGGKCWAYWNYFVDGGNDYFVIA